MTTPSVVTPGNHDGVHLGHRALVAAARDLGSERGLRTVAMFFDPHPAAVVAPQRVPGLLTTSARRTDLLLGAGAEVVLAQPFDRGFASLSPRRFAEDVLVKRAGARAVVVGPDFRFGLQRTGDVALLTELGHELGFDVAQVDPVLHDGERVSSTRVRSLLERGDVAGAAPLLGRAHDVDGVVVEGDRRGRTIGFPTANLACEPIVLPADGVYAVVVRRLDRPDAPRLGGVANLGERPTFAAGRAAEVHLLDFEGDLYGVRLRMAFVTRIRPERRFEHVEALKDQIGADVAAARRALVAVDEGWLTCL